MKNIIKFLISFLLFAGVVAGSIYYMHTKPHTIVFLGDSITFLGEINEKGYVRQFRDAMPDRIKVISAGISAETTEQIKARMDSDVISNNPDVVFIMGGINDFWHLDQVNIEAAVKNVSDMIDMARANHIEPIIMNITLYFEDLEGPYNLVYDKYNEQLAQLAKEKKVQLIDVNSEFKKEIRNKKDDSNVVLCEDDLHLSENGNTVLAKTVLRDFYKTHKLKWMLF